MWQKVIDWKEDGKGCWNCTSHVAGSGGRYPRIKRFHERTNANRFIYEQCFGDIPLGMEVLHSCDNPICINPEHLSLGTHKKNMVDAGDRKRMAYGELHRDHKLTEENVREIRASRLSDEKLATKYNVNPSSIFRARSGEHWRHTI
jgi:HNH endonuclease